MVRPKVFAVLRLITLKLGWLLDWQVCGLGALENLAAIIGGRTVIHAHWIIWAVAHQTAISCKYRNGVYRGYLMICHQHHYLVAVRRYTKGTVIPTISARACVL